FFFQAEDGIRDLIVTGVQTCALPISTEQPEEDSAGDDRSPVVSGSLQTLYQWERLLVDASVIGGRDRWMRRLDGLRRELQKRIEIGRASCRERVKLREVAV